MKVSLKLQDHQQQQTHQNPILFKAKIPIAVFGLPFLSAFSATHHHHHRTSAATSDNLSLSLRTHFPTGPSLKLSYNTPTTTAAAAGTAAVAAPLTLTLKSGISFSGSPNNSPLVISANFSFSPQNPNPNPSFSIQFKPRLGSFSLRKSVSSGGPVSNDRKVINGGTTDNGDNSYGFVPLDRPINWKELTAVDSVAAKDSILSGILMSADTELPVTKRVKVNLRWGVNVPPDYEKQLPYLRVNKVKIERIDEIEEKSSDKKSDSGSGEFEMLKGMYSWMSGELSDLRKENEEMRRTLEEFTLRKPLKSYNGGGGGKRVVQLGESLEGGEKWRMKKGSDVNVQGEKKKNVSSMDVESELQRAIKAASS